MARKYKKTLAILTYIDDTPNMIEEFGWIYKSWIYSGNWKTSDIIAVCNPNVISKLPKDPGVIIIPREPLNIPGSPWESYPFINSIAGLIGEETAYLVDKYPYALRSDADVFLTPALNNFRPDFYVFGRGRYIQTAETRQLITEFGARHGLQHNGIFNCGSSILGPTAGVMHFLEEQTRLCRILLDDFGDNIGEWPKWWRGTLTMYAAELAANHNYYLLFHAYLNVLDFETYRTDKISTSNIYHIHALHSFEYWSKFSYREGKYNDIAVDNLDRDCVNTYCHWIAATKIDKVKEISKYPY